jgi:hypothetical protein
MSLAEIVASNVSMIRERRSNGGGWDSIATKLSEMTGEDVNPASLKVAFSRATRSPVAPASVEKVSRPRAAAKPATTAPAPVKPDAAEGLRAALAEAETRTSEAVRERDSARDEAAKTAEDRDRLAGKIERLKSEIVAASATASSDRSDDDLRTMREQIGALTGELAEARQMVERWEQWASDKGDDAPRSRPIRAAAAILIALLLGSGCGVFVSRFVSDGAAVQVAASMPAEAPKAPSTETGSGSIKVPSTTPASRPAGLPPMPPRPATEGVLTGGRTMKTISLLD